MNFERFCEGIGVFLNGLDFGKFVFDIDFILVGDDGKKAFFIVLDKEVAE